jgi:hypothetical protein
MISLDLPHMSQGDMIDFIEGFRESGLNVA